MKNLLKRLLIGGTCAILALTNLNINTIKVNAANKAPTAAFADSKIGSGIKYCPGTYVVYQIDDAPDHGNLWRTHCNISCQSAEEHWQGDRIGGTSDGDYTENFVNTIFGRKRSYSAMSCTAKWGSREVGGGWWWNGDYYTGSGYRAIQRQWVVHTKCDYCGSTTQGSYTQYCAASKEADHSHKLWASSTGNPVCIYCHTVINAYSGTCRRNLGNKTFTVSWSTKADFINPDGQNSTQSFTGSQKDIVIVRYDSSATLTVEQTSGYDTGNIIGYGYIINGGAEVFAAGSTDKTSMYSYNPSYTFHNVKDYNTVQFHIYTQAGDYYLPIIEVVPGTVITYDPNDGGTNIYNDDNTLKANKTMEKSVFLPNTAVNLKENGYDKKGYYFITWSLNKNTKINQFTNSTDGDVQDKATKDFAKIVDYNKGDLLKGVTGEYTNGTGAWRDKYTYTVYAIWGPNRYDLDYDKGLTNREGSMPSQLYRYDEHVKLHKHTYVGRDYKIVYDNNLPLTYAGVPTASVPHYTLSTGNADGAAPVVKSNLTFKDWYVTSSDNTGHYAENTDLGPMNFEYNDRAHALATAWWNDYSPELPSMFLPGYQWNGWYADAKGTTINTDQVESYSEGYTSSPNIADTDLKGSLKHFTLKQALVPFTTTFYSKWTPNTYYVVYVDYDGNGSTKDIDRLSSHNKVHTCTYDQLYHYEPDRPSSDEKVFLGWSTVNPDTYTWTKENIEDEPIWVQADGEFTNLTQKQHGVVYLWAVWAKVDNEVTPPKNPYDPTPIPDDTNSHLINTNQILIEGTNIYRDPYQTKKWYIQNDTLFSLTFDGISNIDKEYLRKYFMPTQNANNKSWNAANQITKIEVPIAQKTAVTKDAVLTNTGSLVNPKDFTANRSIDYTQLNYKQNYTLDADKDNMLINIYPTSKVTFVNPFRKVVAFTANSKESVDKKHNIEIVCDSTPTTIMIPEEYDVDENGYVPIIEEDVTIPIKYADFVKNVDPSNPEYGSGVNTKNITVTLTQEQTDDGGAPYIQVFKDDTLSEIIKIKESSAYTGEIDLTFNPSKFSEISGFITIKIDITDNVGITVSKEYRFLVMRLETSLKNTVKASKYFNTSAFAQGENGQILIESNGFIDKASIAFPSTLDSLAAEEKSNAGNVENGYWHVGRVLSDTYPRDNAGNITTVLPQMQTKLWGTTHLGGMQWNGSDYEHSYLTHYFYAPLYTQKGKYPVVVTIYKTDPKDDSKIYNVTKTLNLYIGMAEPAGEGEEQLSDPVPITEEIRDELKDN